MCPFAFARISRVRKWHIQDTCLHVRPYVAIYDEQREHFESAYAHRHIHRKKERNVKSEQFDIYD